MKKKIDYDKIFQAVETLRAHNEWRKGDSGPMIRPEIVTEAIDEVVEHLTFVFNVFNEYKAWKKQNEINGRRN